MAFGDFTSDLLGIGSTLLADTSICTNACSSYQGDDLASCMAQCARDQLMPNQQSYQNVTPTVVVQKKDNTFLYLLGGAALIWFLMQKKS